ncbi:MAG: glycosyltransferase [Lyngbya sp. HA4199-MV5]|jgi:glycosyltransferase involved in cell wall biosynthesis|nr:glycosyltransferase [Lyngbya sp. HA4199-MV5]
MFKAQAPVAFFLGSFGGGGIEQVTANLAHGFVKLGIKVDLVLNRGESPHLWKMPAEARVVDLKASTLYKSLPSLVRYLQEERPHALLATDHYQNEIAVLAKYIAGVATRVVVSERNQLSQTVQNATKLKGRLTPLFARLLYPLSDGVVAVSQGVADDLASTASVASERIQTIYNPAIPADILVKAEENVQHPWFTTPDLPVVLGVGKLEEQKDFPTLIRAFSKVRQFTPARLVILGWGPERQNLEVLIKQMGLEADVALLGHVDNPYAYMKRSSVFVLSSAWEGFGNVLVEAMALKIPIVSTDCKSGPAEILANGKYGYLVPVGNNEAMGDAILKVLSGQPRLIDPSWLHQFELETVVRKYLHALKIA